MTPEPVDPLAACRRLDWRFLLPDPRLGRVAYVGPRRGALAAALQLFVETVDVIDADRLPDGMPPAAFDTVAIAAASTSLLRHGSRLLHAGGWIYAEVQRFAPLHRALHPAHPAAFAAAARASGLAGIQLHWHWPAFDTCTRMVPLDDPTALAFLIAKAGGDGITSRAGARVARSLVRSGVLGWTVPCFSVIACRPS